MISHNGIVDVKQVSWMEIGDPAALGKGAIVGACIRLSNDLIGEEKDWSSRPKHLGTRVRTYKRWARCDGLLVGCIHEIRKESCSPGPWTCSCQACDHARRPTRFLFFAALNSDLTFFSSSAVLSCAFWAATKFFSASARAARTVSSVFA